jgi:hypothetical protein
MQAQTGAHTSRHTDRHASRRTERQARRQASKQASTDNHHRETDKMKKVEEGQGWCEGDEARTPPRARKSMRCDAMRACMRAACDAVRACVHAEGRATTGGLRDVC